MVIGPFINASAVLLGGVFGALLSQRLPERIRVSMTSIFGLASLGIGILLVVKCANLPAMVLATLLGALIGEICLLEKGVNTVVAKAHNLFHHSRKKPAHESFIQNFVAIIVLFCASGTGIFGAMNEGMTGDPSILIAKSFLDFFTAMHSITDHPVNTGVGCRADITADHTVDDGRLQRRRRFTAAGNRITHLWH